jgi:hypothetical protein
MKWWMKSLLPFEKLYLEVFRIESGMSAGELPTQYF